MMSCRWLIPLAFLLALATVPPASAGQPHARPGWMVGIGLGIGDGEFTDSEGTTVTADDGLTPQIRVGRMLGRHWQIGVEYQGWLTEVGATLEDTTETGVAGLKLRRSLQNWLLAATWYPGDESSPWGGFYLKAGAGYALGGTAAVLLEEDPDTGEIEQDHGERFDESGLGLVFGLGYEFRLTSTFAAGLAVTANSQDIGEYFIDEASFGSAALVANWYFD
jgi:opacity protein-like surface antigen